MREPKIFKPQATAKLCRQVLKEVERQNSSKLDHLDFSLIQLVTPTTPRDRAIRIAESSSGFLYYVSVTGITGERRELPPELGDNVRWLRERTPLPICIGFGISTPEHVKLLAPAADGLIVGSALVKRIEAARGRPLPELLKDVGDYASSLLAALNEKS